jgi:hypothetical protein
VTIDSLVAERIADAVQKHAAELARPELVTQRSVERVCGMPSRDYLRHCRGGAWPSWADRRLRYARTADVIAWVTAHPVGRTQAANDADVEAQAFARSRSGLRRVAR